MSTAMPSTHSVPPRVTCSDRANATTRSLTGAGVSAPMSPSQQGGVTWNRSRVDATELAQRQDIGHKMLGLVVAAAV
jgi:hypothetical protein